MNRKHFIKVLCGSSAALALTKTGTTSEELDFCRDFNGCVGVDNGDYVSVNFYENYEDSCWRREEGESLVKPTWEIRSYQKEKGTWNEAIDQNGNVYAVEHISFQVNIPPIDINEVCILKPMKPIRLDPPTITLKLKASRVV